MLLKLENIGMIEKAEVKLDGLTLIAGENDTGKTTLGKALYFITKGLEEIFNILNNRPRKNIIFTWDNIFGKNFIFRNKNKITYITKKIHLTFKNALLDFENTNINGSKLIFSKNGFLDIANSKWNNFNLNNVCFIDTPDILTKAKYIKNANFLMSQNNLKFFIPHQVSDLILRLSQDIITNKDNELYKKISEIIHGEVYYDSDRDDFYFKKENVEKEINIHNTSNGIKMFGLLQILIANETIKENSILILDEPEVHLHPKWQLKYAEVLVELVKSGVIVLVTSHSPYIVESLKVYSDKDNLEDKTNFYLAESKDGISSNIKDVTSDLEPIFEKLSEPFNRLEKEEIDNFKW